MFPTLSHLIEYLFNVYLPLPVQTLGFFIALSFVVTYYVFVAEFKRREAIGVFKPFTIEILKGAPASFPEIALNAIVGFAAGYKFIGPLLFDYRNFIFDLRGYFFSWQGSWLMGIAFGAALGWWAWYDKKKQLKAKPELVDELVHPYQLMPLIVFSVGFWGFIGAKIFDCFENWDVFISAPVEHLLSANGFTYFGGLIFGALAYLYIGYNRGLGLAALADNGSPGMMLAYGVGRIGCHLAGDGDWGIYNFTQKPSWLNWLPNWAWSFKYPHNVVNAGLPIHGCNGEYCYQLSHGVYPTPLYEAVACIGLFLLLWIIRKHITIPGLMFSVFLILSGLERLLIETIRVNPRYKLWGLSFTQAELISFLMITGGIIGLLICLLRLRKGAITV